MTPAVEILLGAATMEVAISRKRIDRLAKLLAEEMGRLHGLRYRIQINHSPGVEFVLVTPTNKQ